tara:strand:+ start:506 stop:715 length:210 start_codon:yes stop_codon:yes gene_type:complete
MYLLFLLNLVVLDRCVMIEKTIPAHGFAATVPRLAQTTDVSLTNGDFAERDGAGVIVSVQIVAKILRAQ